MDWKIFVVEFIDKFFNSNFVTVLLGGFLAGYFGVKQYKKQKDLERIDRKYFTEGIEGLINYLGDVREKLENNYATCLLIAEYFRDLPKEYFLEWLDNISNYKFQIVSSKMPKAFFTVNFLLDNEKFKLNLEKIFASLQSINDYFISDFIICVKKYNENHDKENYFEKLKEEANKRNEKIEVIYYIIGYLELILFEIRKMKIDRYEDIEKIKKNKKIISLLNEANEKIEKMLFDGK